MKLDDFLANVYSKVEELVTDEHLHPQQRDMLGRIFAGYRYKTSFNPASDPVSIFHYIHGATGSAPTERTYGAAAFCVLFLLSADLFDDVQDDDLDDAARDAGGAPIAINNAIALLSVALRSLGDVMEAEESQGAALAHMRLFNRISILAICGQHMDLEPDDGSRSLAKVLEINEAKTSSLALITESAALCAGCDEATVASYRRAGQHMSALVQLVDDVRDIFGKVTSPDLSTGRTTFPVAVFRESATPADIEELRGLISRLPDSLSEIRELFYRSGVVDRCAEAIERERRQLHELLSSIGKPHPGHRMWLQVADSLAGAIYELPTLECSLPLYQPEGRWHRLVREQTATIHEHLEGRDLPPPPPFVPWHRREWVFFPEQNVVYYSDLQDQAEEIVPVQAAMLGATEEEATRLLWETVPGVAAHELFHFWRGATGAITEDMWLEEWVANRLAGAYIQRHEPGLTDTVLEVARRINLAAGGELDGNALEILDNLASMNSAEVHAARPYGMDLQQMILMQARMLTLIHSEELDLDEELARWLPAR